MEYPNLTTTQWDVIKRVIRASIMLSEEYALEHTPLRKR